VVCYVQHAILFVKVMISYLVPDKPEWVETAIASLEYQSKLAYKRQVAHHLCSILVFYVFIYLLIYLFIYTFFMPKQHIKLGICESEIFV